MTRGPERLVANGSEHCCIKIRKISTSFQCNSLLLHGLNRPLSLFHTGRSLLQIQQTNKQHCYKQATDIK